jgi:hypothetical protein
MFGLLVARKDPIEHQFRTTVLAGIISPREAKRPSRTDHTNCQKP